MTDAFDITLGPAWTYSATAPAIVSTIQVKLTGPGGTKIQFADGPVVKLVHDAAYWARETRGFDGYSGDRAPANLYNRVFWEGLKGGAPYPVERTGLRPAPPRRRAAHQLELT